MKATARGDLPSLIAFHGMINEVEKDLLEELRERNGPGMVLASDSVRTAFQEITEKLREASAKVAMYGERVFANARRMVVETWERWREELGEKANLLLSFVNKMLWRLTVEILEGAVEHLPSELRSDKWSNKIETVSATITFGATSTLEIGVDRLLKLACTSGTTITVTYGAE